MSACRTGGNPGARPLSFLAGLALLAVLAGAAPPPDAEIFRLRTELERSAYLPAAADWLLRLDLESGVWNLRGALHRRDGELGAAPHRALWLGCRLPAGWRAGLGSQQVVSDLGAALGRGRGGLPPRLGGGLRLRTGSASRWQPEEQGLSLCRETGALRGGLLLASTRRDANVHGDGFVLDLIHQPARRPRLGAWRDRLALGWLTGELPAGWELRGLAGRRVTPTGDIALGGLQAVRLSPKGCVGLAWEGGESRVGLAQGRGRWRGGWWQADLWRGVAGRNHFARPVLPVGARRAGGGQSFQGATRLPGGGASLALALRRLDEAARGAERPALWWRLQLERELSATSARLRLRVTRSAAEDRPAGSGRDAWRVELEPAAAREAVWRLGWEERRVPAGAVRLWHLRLRHEWKRPKWKGGAELHLLTADGDGPGMLEALPLGPGLLRHAYLAGGRQAWGGGLWLERGGQRLAVSLLTRESELDAAGLPLERQPQLLIAWRGEVR